MSNSQVKNLKDLVRIYGNQKTDVEISQLLDIPIERITSLRANLHNNDVTASNNSFTESAYNLINR